MTVLLYTLQVGVSDSTSGGNIIDINLQYISVAQMHFIIAELRIMMYCFKYTTTPYYTILTTAINQINRSLSEMEGNTIFCTLGQNLQGPDAENKVNQII